MFDVVVADRVDVAVADVPSTIVVAPILLVTAAFVLKNEAKSENKSRQSLPDWTCGWGNDVNTSQLYLN